MTEAQIQKAAMLTMRLWGDWLTQKIGQKTVVLGGSLLAFLGFVLIITMNVQILLYIVFFLVSIGCANVVPIRIICGLRRRPSHAVFRYGPRRK